jgi:hypothetical protein
LTFACGKVIQLRRLLFESQGKTLRILEVFVVPVILGNPKEPQTQTVAFHYNLKYMEVEKPPSYFF